MSHLGDVGAPRVQHINDLQQRRGKTEEPVDVTAAWRSSAAMSSISTPEGGSTHTHTHSSAAPACCPSLECMTPVCCLDDSAAAILLRQAACHIQLVRLLCAWLLLKRLLPSLTCVIAGILLRRCCRPLFCSSSQAATSG